MLKDKVILVTGASKGIGQATALLLAKSGAEVVIHGRSEEALTETISLLEAMDKNYFKVAYDITDESSMKEAIISIKKRYGKLDGLVNNAGIMHEGLIGMLSNNQLQAQLAVNISSVYLQIQYAVKLMKYGGTIVNLSSIVGAKGSAGNSLYAATKGAVNALTLSAAKELAPRNIRVNAVAPGFIETNLTSHYKGNKKDKMLENISLNRFGNPKEVANVILFLLSDLSSYVTGQIIGVDGGMVI